MKVLSIGRDESCDIVINDPDSVVSRKHALLKLYPTGKMEIVDLSTNGTFVNGNMISKNHPYAVKRKDIISFARSKQLDWSLVPNYQLRLRGALAGLAAVALIIVGVSLFPSKKEISAPCDPEPASQVQKNDTTKKNKDGDKKDTTSINREDIRNAFKKPEQQNRSEAKDKKENAKAKDNDEDKTKEKPQNTNNENQQEESKTPKKNKTII